MHEYPNVYRHHWRDPSTVQGDPVIIPSKESSKLSVDSRNEAPGAQQSPQLVVDFMPAFGSAVLNSTMPESKGSPLLPPTGPSAAITSEITTIGGKNSEWVSQWISHTDNTQPPKIVSVKTTPDEGEYECHTCGMVFNGGYGWESHMETHSPNRGYIGYLGLSSVQSGQEPMVAQQAALRPQQQPSYSPPYPTLDLPTAVSGVPKLWESCDSCFLAKVDCSKTRPSCVHCLARSAPCFYILSSRAGKKHPNASAFADCSGPVTAVERIDYSLDAAPRQPPTTH